MEYIVPILSVVVVMLMLMPFLSLLFSRESGDERELREDVMVAHSQNIRDKREALDNRVNRL